LSETELLERIKPFVRDYDLSVYSQEQLEQIVHITKEPLVKLTDARHDWRYFFGDDVERNAQIVEEVLQNETAQTLLELMISAWLPDLDLSSLETAQAGVKRLTKELASDHKTKTVMWTLRAALTGRVQGADLATTLTLLGKERIGVRLKSALAIVHA
jgi:glutamyl/glutaminyl-tRNA synthetase